MHSLRKAFLEKRGLIVFQNFLVSVTILLFKFPKCSLLFLRKILTQRFLCLLWRLFTSFVLSRKYLFQSFDLFIMAFLKFSVTKLELSARINFCFFGACLSRIDRKICVKNCAEGNDSSIFVSDISNISSLRFKEIKLIPYWIYVQLCYNRSIDIFLSSIIQNFIFFIVFFLMTSFTRWIIVTIIFWKIPKFIIFNDTWSSFIYSK